MSETNNAAAGAVETTEETIPEVVEETVTMTRSEVDGLLTAAENATKLAAQKSSDAENYAKGMLKYKTMLKDNGIDDEEEKTNITEERIAQIVEEAIKKSIPAVVEPKKDDELEIANAKIAEMRLSMANSKKTISSAAGSNLDKEAGVDKTPAESFFSPEQIAEMKAKFPNVDINEVYKNLPTAETPGYSAKPNA